MIPEWAMLLPWNMLLHGSKLSGIDVNLMASIVMQESSGKSWVTRYEPTFRWVLTPDLFAKQRGITPITEETHQKTSWGLMQLMGGVAREVGFTGDLPELARPTVGLKWSCLKLKSLIDRYGSRDYADVAAAWNAGSPVKLADGTYANQKYVAGVMRLYSQLAPSDS